MAVAQGRIGQVGKPGGGEDIVKTLTEHGYSLLGCLRTKVPDIDDGNRGEAGCHDFGIARGSFFDIEFNITFDAPLYHCLVHTDLHKFPSLTVGGRV